MEWLKKIDEYGRIVISILSLPVAFILALSQFDEILLYIQLHYWVIWSALLAITLFICLSPLHHDDTGTDYKKRVILISRIAVICLSFYVFAIVHWHEIRGDTDGGIQPVVITNGGSTVQPGLLTLAARRCSANVCLKQQQTVSLIDIGLEEELTSYCNYEYCNGLKKISVDELLNAYNPTLGATYINRLKGRQLRYFIYSPIIERNIERRECRSDQIDYDRLLIVLQKAARANNRDLLQYITTAEALRSLPFSKAHRDVLKMLVDAARVPGSLDEYERVLVNKWIRECIGIRMAAVCLRLRNNTDSAYIKRVTAVVHTILVKRLTSGSSVEASIVKPDQRGSVGLPWAVGAVETPLHDIAVRNKGPFALGLTIYPYRPNVTRSVWLVSLRLELEQGSLETEDFLVEMIDPRGS